jgi:acetyl esterase/lipase
VPSFTSSILPAFFRLTRANRTFVDADAARDRVEERRVHPRPFAPPRLRSDVVITATRGVGLTAGWPLYTLTPAVGEASGALIYAHGGAWVNEVALQHWQLAAQLAAEARLAVTVVIYPLVPFGTASAVVPAFAELVLAERARVGERVFLGGDSAGGQIALSAAQLLRDRDHFVLPRTVLIAPALDLSFSNPQIEIVQPSDPWLGKSGSQVYIEHWRGELPVTDPLVSPLFGSLAGLGPVTVFSGTRDILNPDARLLVEKARAAGLELDYHEGTGLVHVYPLTPTPEGRAARALIVRQLAEAHVAEAT